MPVFFCAPRNFHRQPLKNPGAPACSGHRKVAVVPTVRFSRLAPGESQPAKPVFANPPMKIIGMEPLY